MTDFSDPTFLPDSTSLTPEAEARLSVCCFLTGRSNWLQLSDRLPKARYTLLQPQSQSELLKILEQDAQQIDCLLLQESPALVGLVHWLREHATLLPTVIIDADLQNEPPPSLYHAAEVRLSSGQLDQVPTAIDEAIAAFLKLSPAAYTEVDEVDEFGAEMGGYFTMSEDSLNAKNQLLHHQQRLSDKLKERLGYLGVYYKRNPQAFLRNLSLEEQQQIVAQLQSQYRRIVLGYFNSDPEINQKIDAYVDMAFFADLPVSQVVEIHMEVMDEFVKQLKLEGRSDEIVLDYRLTLIDALAHLCEMYRRSIPREAEGYEPFLP